MSEEFGLELDGEVAIITGALSGIGSVTAKSLASRGASVAVATRRKGELEKLAATIEDDGGDALVVPTDIAVDNDIGALVEVTLDEHSCIDILVNNAGLIPLARIDEADHETLQTTIDVSLTGLIALTHAAVPMMAGQESGHIVDLLSVVGRFLQTNSSHYNATKAGVRMFSDSLRLDVAEAGIHISSVEPGAVDTKLLDYILDEEVRKNVRDYVGTMGALAPGDITRTIMFVVT